MSRRTLADLGAGAGAAVGAVTEAMLAEFVAGAQRLVDARQADLAPTQAAPLIGMEAGSRYVRVFRDDGVGRSAYCFIDAGNGDILKAGGWKAPVTAKNRGKRGSLWDADPIACCDAHGTRYLR